jgi:hypothetical protein
MKPPIIEELRADVKWLRQDAKYASEVGDDLEWTVADKRADLLERAANRIAGLEAQVAKQQKLIAKCYPELAWCLCNYCTERRNA